MKSGRTENLVRHWRFDEGAGFATTEKQSGKACDIGGVEAYWRPGVSGTCLSFDSYSSAVTLPAAQCPQLKDEFTVSAWIAIQEYPFNLAAIVDHMDGNKGYLLGVNAKGQVEFRIGNGNAVQSVITGARSALRMGACRRRREERRGGGRLSERQTRRDRDQRCPLSLTRRTPNSPSA